MYLCIDSVKKLSMLLISNNVVNAVYPLSLVECQFCAFVNSVVLFPREWSKFDTCRIQTP